MVQGLRLDYLSPTIYLTDILVILILLFWWWEKRKNPTQSSLSPSGTIRTRLKERFWVGKQNSKKYLIITIIGGFLILNSLLAASQPVAFYKLAKIAEFSLLGFYIAKNTYTLYPLARRAQALLIPYTLALAIIYSSLIAIAQFLNQASLGGPFWFLGERTFNSGTPGIAQMVLDGHLILRPYATFSHPNVLGGFLAITLPLLIFLKPRFRFLPFILGTIALFLTFSRSAWFVFGFSLLIYGIWFIRKNRRELSNYWLIGLLAVFISSIVFFPTIKNLQALTEIQPESIKYRQELNLAAVKMIKSANWRTLFGVGLGNFLVSLPEFYQEKGAVRFFQPTHNIYLLIAAEAGLGGLGLFLWFLFLTLKRRSQYSVFSIQYSIALGAILVLGLFDHYFYTLQQGQLLFSLFLGLAWSFSWRT